MPLEKRAKCKKEELISLLLLLSLSIHRQREEKDLRYLKEKGYIFFPPSYFPRWMQHRAPLHWELGDRTPPIAQVWKFPKQRALDCQSQLSALLPPSVTEALSCGGAGSDRLRLSLACWEAERGVSPGTWWIQTFIVRMTRCLDWYLWHQQRADFSEAASCHSWVPIVKMPASEKEDRRWNQLDRGTGEWLFFKSQ